VRRAITSGETAVAYAEARARARLHHERALNEFIARRRPDLPSAERYQRGPLPPWHPRFGSRADYLDYLARREMGRFDPNVAYPTANGRS
jgi:hypothetical protein